jgi:FkbM family methyltransferase
MKNSTHAMLDKIVSTCCRLDLETWRHSAPRIIAHIPSRSYVVIVPDDEVSLFTSVTPPEYLVIPESTYTAAFQDQWKRVLQGCHEDRRGWYFQQFLKLAAIADAAPTATCMIWDADTIPLRTIQPFDRNGGLLHYCGRGHHSPYFRSINRLLGIPQASPYSFIAQCLPVKTAWVHELKHTVEQQHGVDWFTAIIHSIDFNEPSGFSEYETLGTFIADRYDVGFSPTQRQWSRDGKLLLGSPSHIDAWWARALTFPYDFISFEKWQPSFGKTLYCWPAHVLREVRSWAVECLRRVVLRIRPDPDTQVKKFLRNFFAAASMKYVVQVGANDGRQSDPLRPYFAAEGMYRATLVEPLPYYVDRLKALYRGRNDITVAAVAAGSSSGSFTLYYIDPLIADTMNGDGPFNNWAHGQGSSDRATVEYWIRANAFRGEGYRQTIPAYIEAIRSLSVPVQPISQLVDSIPISLLCIDVQGRELDVLQGVDWSRPPRYIMFEDDLEKGNNTAQYLVTRGYRYVCGHTDKVYEFQPQPSPAAT